MKIMVFPLCFSVFFGIAGGAFSQTRVVIPQGLSNREGNSRVWVPVKYAPSRAQFFYAASVLPKGPMTIRGIGIRRDGETGSAFQAHRFNLEIWMGNPGKDPVAGYTPIWKENLPKDFFPAAKRQRVFFPADLKPFSPPAPFSVRIALDRPFTYKGSGLFLEWRVSGSGNETWEWYADAQEDRAWHGEPQAGGVKYFTGNYLCSYFRGVGTPGVWLGSRVFFRTDFPPDSRGYLGGYAWEVGVIGTSTKRWGNLKLPYNLFGNGCEIMTDVVWSTMVKVPWLGPYLPAGPVDFDLGFFPTSPGLKGLEFNFQGIQVIPTVKGGTKVFTTITARCTVGGGLTGKAQVFCFYGYQDPFLSQGARYHRAVGMVMELW